jgi:hypothetical protein
MTHERRRFNYANNALRRFDDASMTRASLAVAPSVSRFDVFEPMYGTKVYSGVRHEVLAADIGDT